MPKKKWDIEKSRDDFTPHYLEHDRFSAKGHGQHPMDRYLRPGRIPHIWCSGCGLGIATTCFIKALEESGLPLEKNCVVSGIGCTGRVAGYLNVDSYHTTHGRPIPFATGLKLGNPDLTVSVFSGDGDLFAIGGNHFIHAARRNVDINVICVNNFNYGMTGGQGGPTTHIKAKTTTTPYGNFELPFNLPHVAIASGAVYVARWTTLHARRLKESIKEALEKRGFTFVEIISPCPTAYGRRNKLGSGLDEMKYYKERSVIKHNADPAEAYLNVGGDILIGKFKDEDRPTFMDLQKEGILNKFSKNGGGKR
jgi:2-oxoglutarate ferredoxin oxidoreductase subunit beta